MEMLTLIIALSAVIWYVVDRFASLWEGATFSKYITILCAGILAFGCVFSFGLDIIYACGLFAEVSIAGKILTGLTLMSGSSAVAEIIERIKSGPLS